MRALQVLERVPRQPEHLGRVTVVAVCLHTGDHDDRRRVHVPDAYGVVGIG